MTKEEQDAFRRTKQWKEFRDELLKDRDYTCEICGVKKKRGMSIHHYDPDNYDDLQPHKFAVLCRFCHTSLLERKLLRRKDLDIDLFCKNLKEIYHKSRRR